jgi:hypothetical protein
MIERIEVENLANSWREKRDQFEINAKSFKTTGYYGRMAEAERNVSEAIIKDLEALLLKNK